MIAVFFIIVTTIGVAFFFKIKPSPPLSNSNFEEITSSTTEQTLQDSKTGLPTGISYEFATSSSKDAGEEVQNQVTQTVQPIPVLSGTIPEGLLPSTRAEMERIVSELKKNPSNAPLWSALGLYRKAAGDYEGARLAWEFARQLYPEEPVTIENLGVLYGWYLNNPAKAEEMLRLSIEKAPTETSRYLRLFEFYHDVVQDDGKARRAIEQGLRVLPNDPILQAMLE